MDRKEQISVQEREVESHLRDEVKKIGGKAYKLSSQIEKGMPDRLVCLPRGRTVFIETKRPKNGKVSAIQKYRHMELKAMGFEVLVLHTKELVDKFIQESKEGGDIK